MSMNVKQRGQAVATFRSIAVTLMETVARWVPTTPEMEVKLLFGTHIWDLAQHADALGKRTHELRLPLQHSVPPTDAYIGFLQHVRELTGTGERIGALYDVVLPALAARFQDYVARTDALMDAPSVRIFERLLADITRMLGDRAVLLQKVRALPVQPTDWSTALAARERGLQPIAEGAA